MPAPPPGPPARAGPRARRDAEATREAILRAARYLLARQAPADITLKAVAERAGVSPPLILKYFGTKDALFARLLSFDAAATALLDAPWTGSARTWSGTFRSATPSRAPTRCCASSSHRCTTPVPTCSGPTSAGR